MFGFSPIKRDKKRLKRNALQSVTFQVKFNSIDSILEKKDLLQKEFSEQYPNLMDIMDSAAKITFSPEGTPIFESPPTSGGGFQFSSADSFKTLAVTKDTLNLSIFGKIYRNSSDVLNEFENCYIPVMKKIGVKNFNRVAIRKINILDVGPSENRPVDKRLLMEAVYNKSLISGLLAIPNPELLDRGLNYITLKNSDNYKLNLSYGLMQENSKLPNVRQLAFDTDIFKFDAAVEVENLLSEFKKINSEIYNVFIWGMNPTLIRSLDE